MSIKYEISGWVDVLAIVPVTEERVVEVQAGLTEWFDDNGPSFKVRRAHNEIQISFSYRANTLHNGTLSAVAAISTKIEEALDEVAEHRWFNDVKVTAKLVGVRDEQPPEEEGEEDGDDD